MKYFETLIEDQETTISILYKEQIVRIYSSEPNTIHRIIKVIGQPTIKYKKSKTYWSGACWEVNFFEFEKFKELLNRDIFIDKKVKQMQTEEKKQSKRKLKVVKEEVSKKKEKKNKEILNKKEEKIKNKKNIAKQFEQIQLMI